MLENNVEMKYKSKINTVDQCNQNQESLKC